MASRAGRPRRALPLVRLGFSDDGNRPEDTHHPQGLRPVGQRLRPGFNGPLILATELPNGAADLPAVQKVSAALAAADGVAFASPGFPNDPHWPAVTVNSHHRDHDRGRGVGIDSALE